MDTRLQAEKAARLRQLHQGPGILVLPNAWDVASSLVIEQAGFPAIATTSAGVAATLGYPDGQRISAGEMLAAVARIARAVRVPVTADLEAGYAGTPQQIAEFAKQVVHSGAVGLNFEDVTGDDESTHVPLPLQVEKIRALRETSAALGVPLVINARTDICLMPIGDPATRFERTVERLRAYRAAGADCLFAPGVADRDLISRLVKAVEAPLNILMSPGCPTIRELAQLGVRRVSAGSSLMRAALGAARRIAQELRAGTSFGSLYDHPVPFAELKQLLSQSLA